MSDQFLVLLTQSIENPNFEVAESLGMSRLVVNNIQKDQLLASEEHKLLAVGPLSTPVSIFVQYGFIWFTRLFKNNNKCYSIFQCDI